MPISAEEALIFARTKWKDPEFRNQKINEWIHFARTKYLAGVTPPIIRSEWYSLFGLLFISLGLMVYGRKSRN